MIIPTAKNVSATNDYKIIIEFDSGERKIFDITPYITSEWYKELADMNYFKSVFANGFTVE